MDVDTRLLRYFAAVAAEGNLTRAAATVTVHDRRPAGGPPGRVPVVLLRGDAYRAAGGQALVTHGLAVGDGDGIEAQVKFGGQVERHALGSL
jgi:hypothetical protein